MHKIVIAGIGLLAFATVAQPAAAADMPVKAPLYKAPPVPVWTWDGWYVGGNVGYSWAHWGSTSLFSDNFPGPGPGFVGAFTNVDNPNVSGVVGGLHAGRNWQYQNWVVGIEGDFEWSGERRGHDGTGVFAATIGAFNTTITQSQLNTWKLPWFSTIRGRLGWANDTWLVYVTGGAAVGRAQYDHTQTTTATITTLAGAPVASATVTFPFSEGKTRWGYAVGGGIEKAFTPNWVARLEYLYIDLGSYTFLQTTGFDTSVRLHDNIVRVGISYLFNAGPVVARY
jgi:opacity protein-like surface antigen